MSGSGGSLPSYGTTFDGDGKVMTNFGSESADRASDVAIQSDGRIIAFGDSDAISQTDDSFALARYTPTGALDPAFGAGGKVTTSVGPGSDFAILVPGRSARCGRAPEPRTPATPTCSTSRS